MIAQAIEKTLEQQHDWSSEEAFEITPEYISDDIQYWTIAFVNTAFIESADEEGRNFMSAMITFSDLFWKLYGSIKDWGYSQEFVTRVLRKAMKEMAARGMFQPALHQGELYFIHNGGDKRHRTKIQKEAIQEYAAFRRTGLKLIEYNKSKLEALLKID